MDPRDANKTAFACHRSIFRFKKMSFGLCNASVTFQRLMDIVMAGLNFEICLIYLDDIIMFSQSLRKHLERLRTLFERLRQANLKLKPSKCHLMQRRVTFLSFVLSEDGVETDPSKIDAVRNLQTPKSLRQSRCFVGLCQCYNASSRDFPLSPHPSTP